jgi:hypothetical protein
MTQGYEVERSKSLYELEKTEEKHTPQLASQEFVHVFIHKFWLF